jgi:hypothetical protein
LKKEKKVYIAVVGNLCATISMQMNMEFCRDFLSEGNLKEDAD